MFRPTLPALLAPALACALLVAAAPARADDAAPVIKHTPVGKATKGDTITISAVIEDESSIFAPTLYYRYAGGRGFTNVTMSRKGESYVATLQATADLDYWIEAWDELGNGPARYGSAEKPFKVAVAVPVAKAPPPKKVEPAPAPEPEPVVAAAPEPAPAPEPEPTPVVEPAQPEPVAAATWEDPPLLDPPAPFYQQWWFWAGTGGAAAVVTGVLVYALQPPPIYQNVVSASLDTTRP